MVTPNKFHKQDIRKKSVDNGLSFFTLFLLMSALCSLLAFLGSYVVINQQNEKLSNQQYALEGFVLDRQSVQVSQDIPDDSATRETTIFVDNEDLATWFGGWNPDDTQINRYSEISYLVFSYCKKIVSLGDLKAYLSRMEIKNVFIYNVCSSDQLLPSYLEEVFPNSIITQEGTESSSRHEISYLTWILQHFEPGDVNATVLFMHDDAFDEDNSHWLWWGIKDLLKIGSRNGFACVESPIENPSVDRMLGQNMVKSVYHLNEIWGEYHFIDQFFIESYKNFKSSSSSLGDWMKNVLQQDVSNRKYLPVCYGSNFLTTGEQLSLVDPTIWKTIMNELNRGQIIEESHFLERTWGALLSKPLEHTQISLLDRDNLKSKCDQTTFWRDWCGVLTLERESGSLSIDLPQEWSLLSPASIGMLGLADFSLEKMQALWKGVVPRDETDSDSMMGRIHLVISYCDRSLAWIENYVNGKKIESMTIYSTCDRSDVPIPRISVANVKVLKFKSNRQAAYLDWMAKEGNEESFGSDDLVVFLHDNPYTSDNWFWWSFETVLETASTLGYGCAQSSDNKDGTSYSYYHDSFRWQTGRQNFFDNDGALSNGEFGLLLYWLDSLNIHSAKVGKFVPVCYGDSFVVPIERIKSKSPIIEKIKQNLLDGNLEERSTYISRCWAFLFSDKVRKEVTYSIEQLSLPLDRNDEIKYDSEIRFGSIVSNQNGGSFPGLISLSSIDREFDNPYSESSTTDMLWSGNSLYGDTNRLGSMTIVVCYCDQPLTWMNNFLKNSTIPINQIVIYSVCNEDVKNAPPGSRIIPFKSNVNYQYVYAHWVTSMEEISRENKNDVVMFMNDMPYRSKDWLWWNINDILRIVSANGFSCVESCFEVPSRKKLRGAFISPYHSVAKLANYKPDFYKGFFPWFESNFDNMRDWFESIGVSDLLRRFVIPVCYGGSFATTKGQLLQANSTISKMMTYLSRNKDIEEEYFAERTWAAILSKPLSAVGSNKFKQVVRVFQCDIGFEMRCGTGFFRENTGKGVFPPPHLKPLSFEGALVNYPFIDENNITALWTGNVVEGEPENLGELHVVVSHCDKPLHWLNEFMSGHEVARITIYSKCGNAVEGAPDGSIIETLPNVGRCDHTYAHWMANMDRNTGKNKFDVFLFIKDNNHRSDTWALWSMDDMFRIVSGNGFVCGESVLPSPGEIGFENISMSIYHDYVWWRQFANNGYSREADRDAIQTFKSQYTELGDWVDDLGLIIQRPFLPVCYGGIFMTTRHQIERQDVSVWKKLEQSLSRDDNIEEGHFAERTWAALLSKPINPEKNFYLQERNGLKRCIGHFKGRCGILTIKPWNVDAMIAKQGS